MRKFLISTATALLAVALLMSGTPAQAGTLTWTDPTGDAAPEGLPIPPLSEPGYDITRSTLASDGTTLTWTAEVPGLTADPPPKATGMHFTFSFTFGENSYRWVVAKDRLGAGGTTFYIAGDAGSDAADCPKCLGKIDVEGKVVSITAPIASMDRGIEGKFGPGSMLEAIAAEAGRYYDAGVRYFPTDESAQAPAPATLAG